MSDHVVVARGLSKRYGTRVAVDHVDFDVRAGECFGVLGPNGAGKSTIMKTIYGLARVDGGTLQVLGHDAARRPRDVKARVGVVPQDDNLDGELSVRENLVLQAGYFGLRRGAAQRADELLELAGLADRGGAAPSELSGGMRRRLLIVRALVAGPSLVVLDEPTTGLDPGARQTIWSMLQRLRADGIALLLTTHYMEEATHLCDRLMIIDRGRVVEHGTPAELIARHRQRDLESVFLHLTGHELAA